jgi:hypothetical protein
MRACVCVRCAGAHADTRKQGSGSQARAMSRLVVGRFAVLCWLRNTPHLNCIVAVGLEVNEGLVPAGHHKKV